MYESMTIKKQYGEYSVIKEDTFKKAAWTVKMSYLFMLAFAIYLLLTVILIFTDQKVPVLPKISIAMGGSEETVLKDKMDPWIVRLFNVGTMLTYLSQTVFIMYHRGTLKVNTARTIRSCAIHHFIVFVIVGVSFFIINILYFVVNIENGGSAIIFLVLLLIILTVI